MSSANQRSRDQASWPVSRGLLQTVDVAHRRGRSDASATRGETAASACLAQSGSAGPASRVGRFAGHAFVPVGRTRWVLAASARPCLLRVLHGACSSATADPCLRAIVSYLITLFCSSRMP